MTLSLTKKLEIFRGGIQIDSAGNERYYSESDLQQVVENFQPDTVPFIVSHDDTQPARGWVKRVWRNGLSLWADVKFTGDMLADMAAGRWRRISSGFYGANSPVNPSPGNLVLRHIAAVHIPAVKGLTLDLPEFSEPIFDDSDANPKVEGTFNTENTMENQELQAVETAEEQNLDQAVEEIDLLDENELLAELDADFSEAIEETVVEEVDMMDFAEKKAKAKAEEPVAKVKPEVQENAEIAALKKIIEAQQAQLLRGEALSFCEGLQSEGRILPSMDVSKIADFMVMLKLMSGEDFSEGTETAHDWFKGLLSSLPTKVDFSEKRYSEQMEDEDASLDDRGKLHAKAKKIQAKEGISYAEAIKKCM